MSKPNGKIIWEQNGKCPYCSKQIHTALFRVTVTPGVKAITELRGVIEKNPQSTLEEDYKKELRRSKGSWRPKEWGPEEDYQTSIKKGQENDVYSPPVKQRGRPKK